MSIPVGADINRRIRDVVLLENGWQQKHLKTIETNYKRAIYFNEVMQWLVPIYLNKDIKLLTEFNMALIDEICHQLKIKTKISYSWNYFLSEGRTERLVSFCEQTKAYIYVSGPGARGYLDESLFKRKGIQVEWFDYSGYQAYAQLWGDFEHNVSILDLLFNCGADSLNYMRCKA